MDLIVKPTDLCNFACTFCSSPELSKEKAKMLDLQKIFDFLDRFPETNTIIVNGGDPLMVKPEYYLKLINFLEERNIDCIISMTSNLWDYYKKPLKWNKVISHPKVSMMTSFNYGETRRISIKRNFTEQIFWDISNTFLYDFGYRPDFISVVTQDNYKDVIDNVRLAKDMGVQCKLNPAVASGLESNAFPLAEMYKIYLEIYREGLAKYEYNTLQMLKGIHSVGTTCPLSTNCDSHIRCIQPDGDYYSCGAFGDDHDKSIDFTQEVKFNKFFTPLSDSPELLSLKDECFGCEMFNICNGCKKTIKDTKNEGRVDSHCKTMKQIANDIIELNIGA